MESNAAKETELANMASHSNHKQKIKYLEKLQEELDDTREVFNLLSPSVWCMTLSWDCSFFQKLRVSYNREMKSQSQVVMLRKQLELDGRTASPMKSDGATRHCSGPSSSSSPARPLDDKENKCS